MKRNCPLHVSWSMPCRPWRHLSPPLKQQPWPHCSRCRCADVKKTSNHIIWFGGIKPASIGILQRYNEDTSGDIMVIWWVYNGTAMWYVPWSRWNIGVIVIHPISCYWIDLPMGNQPMFWPWHIWVCLKITHPFYKQLMGNTWFHESVDDLEKPSNLGSQML